MNSRIIIKIKDVYFLQSKTFTDNPTKLLLDKEFFAPLNLFRITNLYKATKKPSNINESINIFHNLIKSISGLAINGKIESLFSIMDATIVVNLMQEAKEISGFKGANLLNYYFIEVEQDVAEEVLVLVNELILNQKSGVEFTYIEGEVFDGSKEAVKDSTLSEMQSFSKNDKNVNKININDTKSNQTAATTANLISSIEILFNNYFNFEKYHNGSIPVVQVVDLEQGWNFSNNGISSLFNTTIPQILGGGHNYTDIPHGTNTLNVLFGNSATSTTPRLGGLCKNAKPLVASIWSPPVLGTTPVKNISVALAKILGKNGVSSPLNTGDIVLIEVQLIKSTGAKENKLFPVEIDQAIFDTIAYGVGKNIIIVEAAANGNINLDFKKPTDSSAVNLTTLNSGAIMVGALSKRSDGSLRKHIQSNSGSRIDTYCFGDVLNTTAGTNFSATSLASAIIASLVANMQIIRKMKGKPLLKNADIKAFLGSNASNIPNNGGNFSASL